MTDRLGSLQCGRRRFLLSSAGVVAASASGFIPAVALSQEDKPLPDYASWKDAEDLIVHSERTLETQRGAMGSAVTSARDLYIRNNLPPPPEQVMADRDAWQIAFEGVANPRSMTLADLKRLGAETVACVLQCSGNGRAFFDHETSGTQWSVGAAGNVLWTGVPLKRVIEELGGPVPGAAFLTGTGGEVLPEGLDPATVIVERSVPLPATDIAFLAFELNGEPLPLAHGGPVRLVIPGYFGINNIKYVRRVALTPEESQAKIQRSGYRIRPVGVEGDPSQPSMWEMYVKSWVTSPLMNVETGRTQIQGVAMGGSNPVRSVEVSVDGGETWQEARFTGPDLGPFAWRPFALEAELEPGSYVVASRATDSNGVVQPDEFIPNERGYGHNGWRDHAIELVVAG